jgi:hypothetical protein
MLPSIVSSEKVKRIIKYRVHIVRELAQGTLSYDFLELIVAGANANASRFKVVLFEPTCYCAHKQVYYGTHVLLGV